MLQERLEAKWIECFERSFVLNGVVSGDTVSIVSESQSRQILINLAEHALSRIGARPVHVRVPSPPLTDPVPVRSTGASHALAGYDVIFPSLAACKLVVDITVEGLIHTKALQSIISNGGRVFMISNEHPEILERCMPNPELRSKVDKSLELLKKANLMNVTSNAGTDLEVQVKNAPLRGGAGYLTGEDKVAYWPAGLALFFPERQTVNGTIVFDVGDVNLTFKRYFESKVTYTIKDDIVVSIDGNNLDAELLRAYYESWDDPNAYAISHVGWGLNPQAKWESLAMYDKTQINGTEFRALAGSFMISTGANEFLDRYTNCHFDFPMRHCSVRLDGSQIISDGDLVGDLS